MLGLTPLSNPTLLIFERLLFLVLQLKVGPRMQPAGKVTDNGKL